MRSITRVVLLACLCLQLALANDLISEYDCVNKPLSFSYQFADKYDEAIGLVKPYKYTYVGLPPGMQTQGNTILGVPKAIGQFPFTIFIEDAQGSSIAQLFKMVVSPNLIVQIYSASAVSSAQQQSQSSSSVSYSSNSLSREKDTVQKTEYSIKSLGALAGQPVNIDQYQKSNCGSSVQANSKRSDIIVGQFSGINSTPKPPNSFASDKPFQGTTVLSSNSASSDSSFLKPMATPLPFKQSLAGSATAQSSVTSSYNLQSARLTNQILSYRYKYDDCRDSHTASTLETHQAVIFNRQINANKAVANLLGIIATLTANLNGIRDDLPKATDIHNTILGELKRIQIEISSLQAQKRSAAAVSSMRLTELNNIENSMKAMQADLENTHKKKDQHLQISIEEDSASRALVLQIQQARLQLENGLAAQKQAILAFQKFTYQISIQQTRISKLRAQIANAPQMKTVSNAELQKARDRISQLKLQMEAAQADLITAQKNAAYYETIAVRGPQEITQIQTTIRTQRITVETGLKLNVQQTNARVEAAKQKVNQLRLKAEQSKSKASKCASTVKGIEEDIPKKESNLREYEVRMTKAMELYSVAKAQQVRYSTMCVQIQERAKDIEIRVNSAQQILKALTEKYDRTAAQLNEAKINLQKARSEKEIADRAVDQQIRSTSGALPYSIALHGNDFRSNPIMGNNPSGAAGGVPKTLPGEYPSASGTISEQTLTKVMKAVSSDPSHFISTAVSSGVDPNKLYPLVLPYLQDRFQCGKQSTAFSSDGISGLIMGVFKDYFDVNVAGQNFKVRMSKCTQIRATKPNCSPKRGDKLLWSGNLAEQRVVNASFVTCTCL